MKIYQRFYIQTDSPCEIEQLVNDVLRTANAGGGMQPIVVQPGPHKGCITPKRDIFFSVVSPQTPDDHAGWFYLGSSIDFGTEAAIQVAEALHRSDLVITFATDTTSAADELEPPARIVGEGHSLLRHVDLRGYAPAS